MTNLYNIYTNMIQPYKMSSLFGDTGVQGSRKAQFLVPRASGGDLIIGQRHDGRVVLRGESVSLS